MAFFVSRRSGDAANNVIYDGGGIGGVVVADSVCGDGRLDLFDGSLDGAKVFLKSWPGIVGVGEGLLHLYVIWGRLKRALNR